MVNDLIKQESIVGSVNMLAPINLTGYGVFGKNVTKALGGKAALFPIGQIQTDDPQGDNQWLGEAIQRGQFFDKNAPSLRLFHQFDMAQHVGKGEHIGFPIFELTEFSALEKHQLRSLDKLFVTSEWAREVCGQNRIAVPTYAVPLGVDRTIFNEKISEKETVLNQLNLRKVNDETVIFMNCGKWEYRKGHDVLVNAFAKAFPGNENVLLIMNCNNPCVGIIPPTYNKEWEQLYKNTLGEKVFVLENRLQKQSDVAKLMSVANCGVFPARAEGWNLELLEIMSMGKVVITTNYGAHTQYCTKENSRLIEMGCMETAFDGVFFNDPNQQGTWASFGQKETNQLIEHLRQVYLDGRQSRLYNGAGVGTAEKLTWANTAEIILNSI